LQPAEGVKILFKSILEIQVKIISCILKIKILSCTTLRKSRDVEEIGRARREKKMEGGEELKNNSVTFIL